MGVSRVACMLSFGLTACGTLSTARPLEQGETLIGATLAGPMIDFGGPLPLPFAVVEARHGIAGGGIPEDIGLTTYLARLKGFLREHCF